MNEPRQRIVVDGVAFSQVFRFQKILSAITHAMQPPRLLVALFMVVALVAVGRMWDAWSGDPTIHPQGILSGLPEEDAEWRTAKNIALRPISEKYIDYLKREYDVEGTRRFTPPADLDATKIRRAAERTYKSDRERMVENEVGGVALAQHDADFRADMAVIDQYEKDSPYEATAGQIARGLREVVNGVFHLDPGAVFGSLTDLLIRTPIALWDQRPWFTVFYGFFALIMIAIGGGALCRMSACEVAGRERLRAADAYMFAFQSWVKLVLAPLLPLLLAGFLALVLAAAGVVLFLPLLDVLGGLFYGVNLLVGFVIAFLLLALGFSFILLLPAVATENCSPADALQRSVAYLLSRPLHLLGYTIVGIVGLGIGYLVVALVAAATLNITATTTGWLSDNPAVSIAGGFWIDDLTPKPGGYQPDWHHEWSAGLISAWQRIIILLVASYVVSYLFSSTTVIYLLMRKTVDDQDLSEIWRPGLVPGTLAPMPAAIVTPVGGEPVSAEPGLANADLADEPDDTEDDADSGSAASSGGAPKPRRATAKKKKKTGTPKKKA